MKCFVVDYKENDQTIPMKTKLFSYEHEQFEAEKFCKTVKDRGGAVNIRIREVQIPH